MRAQPRLVTPIFLAGIALIGTTSPGRGDSKTSVDRSYALLRLPGQTGASCLSCHQEGRLPKTATPDSLRDHVSLHLPGMTAAELANLQRHIATLKAGGSQAPRSSSTEMLESVRGLGYVEYRTGAELPILRRGLRLNAHELSQVATGKTRLVANPASPTGMALELDGAGLTGLVLPPAGADPGTYLLTLRLAGPTSAVPLRMSLTGANLPTIDRPVERVPPSTEATATFKIDQAVPLTIALAPTGAATTSIAELSIERQ